MNSRKAFRSVLLSIIIALALVAQAAATSPLDTWQPRNPLPLLGNNLNGIACSDRTCVAVGKDTNPLPNGGGRILISSDGYNWSVRKSAMVDPTTGAPIIPYAAAFGDPEGNGVGIWIVVGNKGTTLKSTDRGLTWTTVFQGYDDADELRGITYGKGTNAATPLFVAVGKNGKVLTSPNGNSWNKPVTLINSSMNGIAFGGGVFVAVGSVATAPAPQMYTIMTSSDAANWTPTHWPLAVTSTEKLMSVTYGKDSNGNYRFVAVGNVTVVSDDGYTWTTPVTTGETTVLGGVAYGNNRFVAVSSTSGGVITNSKDPSLSADWSKWSSGILGFPAAGSPANALNGIVFFKTIFIAIGSDTKLLTSPDGQSWTERASVTSNFLYGTAYGNNRYVAVGWGGKILSSANGLTWVERVSGVTGALFGVTFGKDLFVAVGSGGKISTSPDGLVWTARSSGVTDPLFAVACNGNAFVAVGSRGKISTSTDGVHWSARQSGTVNHLFGVSFANNRFVAVGQNGRIISSSSGITWSNNSPSYVVPTFKPECLYGVTYAANAYVAVGDNGRILTSPDLKAWTSRPAGCANGLRAVGYFDNVLVALGSGGKILTSKTDGTSWTARTSGINYSLLAMAQDANNHLYVTGAYATILFSKHSETTPWESWIIRSSGTYKQLKSIAYGDGVFVAVGETGTVLTSRNGVIWDVKTIPLATWLNGVAYGKGRRFVAVGDTGNDGRVYTSQDKGVTWTCTFPDAYFNPSNLNAVAYGNGRFVASGVDGIELVSYDGALGSTGDWWSEMYLEACYDIKGIAYGSGTFVMVGSPNRTFLTSKTPEDLWTIRWAPFFPQDTALGFTGIAYGAGIFTVVGPKVKIGISEDYAVTWKQVPLVDYKGTFDFTGITYGGDSAFTAVGTVGKILTSPNGKDWTFRKSGTTVDLNGMIYGPSVSGNTYIAVGKNGMILQSGVLP
ncbi:MAG: hypothetical protein AB9866_03995 [Syntrophobacteraceae bacterium]